VAALVILGAYYGFTALFETIGPKSLVWPRYIVDPNYGIHAGRARGPFAEAVTFGIGLFVCAVGCAIAMMTWETRRWRAAAAAVGLLCLLGMLFTVTRSVWIGGVVGILAFMLAIRELRRWVIPGLLAATALILVALIAVPGLQAKVQSRADQQATVWDRQNLDRAAIDMAEHKPLVGFGWDTFIAKSPDYFQQSANYPLPVGPEIVHNVWLSFLAELGLVGTALLVGTMLIGIGGVLLLRGPPSARVWQAFLLGYVVCYLVVSNFVTPETFPHLVLWLLGGVALGAVRQPRAEEGASASTRIELAPSYA
jgi:O-antigen ligase